MKRLARLTVLGVLMAAAWVIGGTGCSGNASAGGGECIVGATECAIGCDPNLGCVDCFDDGDCGAAAPFCIQGQCEECSDSGDCGVAQVCFPREHQCEDPCTGNGDCDQDDEPLCDVETGICLQCLEDVDCPTGRPLCDPAFGQCAECMADADCPATDPVCNFEDGECEQCLVDSQCEPNQVCTNDHRCHDACLSDSDCENAERPFCNVESRECVECTTNDQCGLVEPVCTDNGRCVMCVLDTDCGEEAPICSDRECVQCETDAHCPDPAFPACDGNLCVVD